MPGGYWRAVGQNLDVLWAMHAAFNSRDFDSVVDHLHPEVELHPAIEGLDTRASYRGREEWRQYVELINEAWETQTIEVQEIIEAGDRILVDERWHVRGRQGIELDFYLTDVYSFRDGLVVRIDGFADKAEAREALGSRDQA
jgi:ketosteroid isomerase-like protein